MAEQKEPGGKNPGGQDQDRDQGPVGAWQPTTPAELAEQEEGLKLVAEVLTAQQQSRAGALATAKSIKTLKDTKKYRGVAPRAGEMLISKDGRYTWADFTRYRLKMGPTQAAKYLHVVNRYDEAALLAVSVETLDLFAKFQDRERKPVPRNPAGMLFHTAQRGPVLIEDLTNDEAQDLFLRPSQPEAEPSPELQKEVGELLGYLANLGFRTPVLSAVATTEREQLKLLMDPREFRALVLRAMGQPAPEAKDDKPAEPTEWQKKLLDALPANVAVPESVFEEARKNLEKHLRDAVGKGKNVVKPTKKPARKAPAKKPSSPGRKPR